MLREKQRCEKFQNNKGKDRTETENRKISNSDLETSWREEEVERSVNAERKRCRKMRATRKKDAIHTTQKRERVKEKQTERERAREKA